MEAWSQRLDLVETANRFGSPLYITHLGQLRRNLDAFEQLTGTMQSVVYPVRANPALAVLRALAHAGAAADCASPHEVDLALAAGFPIRRLLYNSPAPDHDLMANLYLAGAQVVADSAQILDELRRRIPAVTPSGTLLLRVNPPQTCGMHQGAEWETLVTHATPEGKFGIPAEALVGLLRHCPLPVQGLHLHVGTQRASRTPFEKALDILHDLAETIQRQTAHRITVLDLGGGLGIPFPSNQAFPDLETFVQTMRPRLLPRYRYLVEPGHALTGDSLALLTRIREVKSIRDKRWAIVDTGADRLIKVTLLAGPHRITDARHRGLPTQGPDAIGGPLGFAGDVLLPATNLDGLQSGDPLLIQHVGAYCFSAANHFNGLTGPAHLVMDDQDDGLRVVYRAEDAFFDHTLLEHTWTPDDRGDGERVIPTERITALQSAYLKPGARKDHYEFTGARAIDPRTVAFTLHAESALGLLSLPFAVRIASDATSVAALHLLGHTCKDIAVWGTRLCMTADTLLRLGRPLVMTVHITPAIPPLGGKRATHLSYWEIDHGRFRGLFRFSL